ncbi:MAG: isochorismate synthase [Streptosporangiales bacterium]
MRGPLATEPAGLDDLLAAYRPDDSTLLAGPSGALLATGVHARLPAEPGSAAWQALPERVADLLASAEGSAIAVGAIPFERDKPAHLYVPANTRRTGPSPETATDRAPRHDDQEWQVRHEPTPEQYAKAVAECVRRFADGPLEKVVLARTAHLTGHAPVDVPALVASLAQRDPGGYTFAVNVAGDGPAPRTFLGTSPELVVRRAGTRVVAFPHAGTAPRSTDRDEDRALAAALLHSAKDRHEHEVVVRHVAQHLRPFCRSLAVPPEPHLVSTRTLWHLATPIEGELADEATTSLHLARALHPTPAVCGTPTDLASRTLTELEPFDRGYYAGMVGWTDGSGDGDWIVAIRSAEVEADRMRLFAGAGIVAGSDPDDEVRETSAKFRTLLGAMGVDATL